MSAWPDNIAVKTRRAGRACDEQIDCAVVVEIPRGQATSHTGDFGELLRRPGQFAEAALAVVGEQLVML